MKRVRRGWWRAAAWGVLAGAGAAWGQGALAPPVPPGPMMKTLAQIEPRTPITNVPYSITQPGAYYLTTNLTSTGDGITIRTNAVEVDLMGFALTGDRGTGDYGIFIDGTNNALVSGVVIRNGILRNFDSGIRANGCHNGRFEGLAISGNAQAGIWLYGTYGGCNGNVIADCAIGGNTKDGINFYGWKGSCDGNMVVDCTVTGNGDAGIRLYGYGDLSLPTRCDGNRIARCTVTHNLTNGIVLDGSYSGRCAGNAVTESTVARNGGYGLLLMGSSSGKCQGNVVADCVVAGNGSLGVLITGSPGGTCDGNAVAGCTVHGNLDNGIHVVVARGNRVDGNHVTYHAGESYGISAVSASSNLYVRNSSVGHTYNYVPGAGDTYGPTVTNQGELATSGKPAHPWANFSR